VAVDDGDTMPRRDRIREYKKREWWEALSLSLSFLVLTHND
jgi:hypothetical protein